MGNRKLGYLPDPHDPRDLDLVSLQLPNDLPKAYSLRQYIPEVLDQRSTSSCVAHAFAQAIVIAERKRGVELVTPSRLFIYFCARRQHSGMLVTDSGTYLRSAAAGLQKLGAPPEPEWPFGSNMVHVNRPPRFSAYLRAHGRRGGGYFRIGALGSERLEAIKQAVYDGMPVAFGTRVSRGFLEFAGRAPIDIPKATEPVAGNHAMLVVGWEETPVGTNFEIVNSWGPSWGEHGFAWLTEAYMAWTFTADLWCVRGWEAVARVA